MDVLKNVEIDPLGKLIMGGFAQDRATESRAARLSTVERRIIKDSDQCPQCVSNNDPTKVPVHPNCHCDVITDTVETGTVDTANRLIGDVLFRAMEGVEFVGAEDISSVQLAPETIAVFPPEEVRFSDIARWLEQMQPYLDQADTYISIVVDDDSEEAAQDIQEVIEVLAQDADAGLIALKDKKLWLSIAKAAI